MESTTQADPRSLATVPSVAMDANLMAATSHGDCQLLKEHQKVEEGTTAVTLVAPAMQPLLLAAACKGNVKELNYLLNREDIRFQHNMPSEEFLNLLEAYNAGSCTNASLAMQRVAADVEKGASIQAPSATTLLAGITPKGDTMLHVVAANGDGDEYLTCATLIHGMDKQVLYKKNSKGDTPLHCAARAGKSQMISHFIYLARGDNRVEDLLRMENNSKETALHEAVRIGSNDIVKKLLRADPELACFPTHGTSPLYLAITLKEHRIAGTLYNDSKDNILSYSGRNRQNALHAAVMRDAAITKKMLEWDKTKHLTTERDEKGSTPLHFAAGLEKSVCSQVFDANRAALYQPDDGGLSPIHVAASVGSRNAIAMFIGKCPSSAGLRDAKGRTFLHIAVEKGKLRPVRYACGNRSMSWIMNMQDNDGNTALHLAVMAGNLVIFAALFGNRRVNLNLSNAKGETPLDIAQYKVPPSFSFKTNSENWMRQALTAAHAKSGIRRQDHFNEEYQGIHGVRSEYEKKELDMLRESTQSQSIGSVLIATVTFGAMFALPGGYIQDDHLHGGAPTLAGRYAFHAFIMANTIAFVSSAIATVGFMYAGSAMQNLESRKAHFSRTICFVHTSIMAMTVAFALGVYTVLAPVAQNTAIAICVISPVVVVYNFAEFWTNWAVFAIPFFNRMGPVWAIRTYTLLVLGNLLSVLWIFMVIFAWAAYASNRTSVSVPQAQPPAPLN